MAVDQIVVRLSALGQTLATAESLTAGLVAATIVDVPGSSKVFRGGLVVYATDLKHSLAGVDAGLLEREGPVSHDVALALALGARERCGADWGVSTTGVAGPTPQDGVAVGTVFVAVCGPSPSSAVVQELALSGDRPTIRATTVAAALTLLATALSG
ncbi:CinA family protein [Allorhizocola rhizosphaerae]|uniref:CinA family protein n=1 Tax=Allorhizocola rhizosphaerae TaxID=1872709 RepID=UPI000E3E30A3|nr:CinA family protein [Allorhizocola rhizosphaerae]